MMLDELASKLEKVRPTARGLMGLCPGHADTYPSLGACEGEKGLLLKCWTGCSIEQICSGLGIEVSSLFYDSGKSSNGVPKPSRPRTMRWRTFSKLMGSVVDGHSLEGLKILSAAKGMDIAGWNDNDLDSALRTIGFA